MRPSQGTRESCCPGPASVFNATDSQNAKSLPLTLHDPNQNITNYHSHIETDGSAAQPKDDC